MRCDAHLDDLKTELLSIEEKLPADAVFPVRGSLSRRAAWRQLAKEARSPMDVASAVVLLDYMVRAPPEAYTSLLPF